LTAFVAAVSTTPVNLCVGVVPLQQSSERGQAAQWAVGAWTVGGNLPDARIALQSTAGTGAPTFSFGCAAGDGTSECDLGALDAASAQRQFQAEVTVPLTATGTAVSLTVIGSAGNLAMDPSAAASVVILAPASPVGANLSSLTGMAPVGVAAPTPMVTAGGSAAGMFPTLAPSPSQAEGETPVANVSALSHGGTPVGSEMAEVGGLAALAVAMLLAVTRLSFRRPVARSAPRHAAKGSTAAAASPAELPAERAD
jgi:hypothetical protein